MAESTVPRVFGWAAVSTAAQAEDDKYSLPTQVQRIKDYADSIGGRLVHVAQVAGHSRVYKSLHDMEEAFAQDNVPALVELLDAINRKAFDILVVTDADRIARDIAPFSEFVHRVTDSGATLYCLADRLMVDDAFADLFSVFRGLVSAVEVKRLKEKYQTGTRHRASLGLHGSGRLLGTHREIHDLKAPLHTRIELDESQARLWQDVATLILERVAWDVIEAELLKRFGHCNPATGLPFAPYQIRSIVFNPYFWGHSARYYSGKTGPWVYDRSESVPPGVMVWRDMLPPVLDAETGQKVIGELERRKNMGLGRAKSDSQYAFTGLIVCDQCGTRMSAGVLNVNTRYAHVYWRCTRKAYQRRYPELPTCTAHRMLRDDVARRWVGERLAEMIDADELAPFWGEVDEVDPAIRVAEIRKEIQEKGRQLDALIRAQSRAALNVQARYDSQIAALDAQLKGLDAAIVEAERPIRIRARDNELRQEALNEIRAMGLERFWEQTPGRINQVLAGVLGNRRFAVRDGEIVGFSRRG